MKLSPIKVHSFQTNLLSWHEKNTRSFPWRNTHDPYHILVSEFMLQQTQTRRVIPKYETFILTFPTIDSLSHSSLSDVLSQWQGIGYNRRAKYLFETARNIVRDYAGTIPSDPELLDSFPGIGAYTAAAISTFAFNKPNIMIETNIRSVYIHEFFSKRKVVSDSEIIPLIEQTLYLKDPRTWYYALMDFGVHLKKTRENPARKSKHYTKQKPFKGSRREIRGKIIKVLLAKKLTSDEISKETETPIPAINETLTHLIDEKLVIKDTSNTYRLSD